MIQKLLLTGSFFCPITESHKGTHTKATLIAVLQKKYYESCKMHHYSPVCHYGIIPLPQLLVQKIRIRLKLQPMPF